MALFRKKSIHRQTFTGGMNSDLADEKMASTMGRIFLNCRVLSTAEGNEGVVVTSKGNVLITTPLPDGVCETIGTGIDEVNNRVFFAVWNDGGLHTWYFYDVVTNTITQLLQNLTDTDEVDIFQWSKDFPILHIDIPDGNLLYYCDGLNKACKFNIKKALDNSDTGYGYTVEQPFILAYKACPTYAPVPVYTTDTTTNSNLVYANLYKFCYRFIYDDGEQSNYSDLSRVALPPNQSYLGAQAVTTDNNVINVPVQTGGRTVAIIEIAMKQNRLAWQTCAILNKDQLNIADNSYYVFSFYNNGSYTTANEALINRPYNFIFRIPTAQAYVPPAMTYTGGDEGFDNVLVDIGVVAGSTDLFLPDSTDNELNHPDIGIEQVSYTTNKQLLQIVRYNPTISFVIGSDVKSGNVFTINGSNKGAPTHALPFAGKDNYNFSYKANQSDTSVSVANRIMAFLRGIGRGPVFNYSVDISNNVTFFYSYLGQWRENITKFTGSVTPVSFTSLKDNGVSMQVMKSGSMRQYAVGYENDIQQKSPSYTSDTCKIRVPFLSESPDGILQRPFHTVSIMHQPPVWATHWILYRTPDEVDFIQLLIQKVIEVTVTTANNNGVYLDLVVGSLSTYNAIHKDSILAHQFTRGDRLRLIKNENTNAFYTPFYETEILSYDEITTEVVNAQITVYGDDTVSPSDGPRTDYIGKNIQIAGYERTIIDISGGRYVLDNIINIGPVLGTFIEPSYTFIDRRGIVRISKPPAHYDVQDFSTVEIYTPQASTQNLNFTDFRDTAQKFEILNAGTPTRAHAGSHQNQDGTSPSTLVSTPAQVIVTEGDVYIRDRELPSNTSIVNTQVIVDAVEDPSFSDFYESNLNNLGRVIPTDPNPGVKHFGSRIRFSGNFIQDTKINGLSDFNDLDREDYNDQNGDFVLTKFIRKRLYAFKKLRDCWIPVLQTIFVDQKGQEVIGTSNKLLNPIQYFDYDGGMGDNPESWFIGENGYQYHAMPMRGVFVRLAGDGIIEISKLYGFDSQARGILHSVQKYKLRVPGGFDPVNSEGNWSVKNFIAPLFNNLLVAPDWDTFNAEVPAGATPIIVTQPVNGSVNINGNGDFEILMDTDFVGSDSFTYKFQYVDLTFSDIINGCIDSVETPPPTVGYRIRTASVYCEKIDGSAIPNVFAIKNNHSSKLLAITGVVFNGTAEPGLAISAGNTDLSNCPSGPNPSVFVINVGATYTPSTAVMTATGMAPISGVITGSLPGAVVITFSGIDCSTYHNFTININP